MSKDPIVAEVRAARDRLAADCNYDIRRIVKRAQRAQQNAGKPVVSFERRTRNNDASRDRAKNRAAR